MILALIKSMIIGFLVAMPVGPIGILCINHSMRGGMRLGLAAGLGAALADALFGLIALIGIAALVDTLDNYSSTLQIAGAVFLVVLGLKIVMTPPSTLEYDPEKEGTAWAFGSTFFLTLTNPITILSFVGIFAGTGLTLGEGSWFSSFWIALGIFLGSAIWWLALSSVAGLVRQKVSTRARSLISQISGALILAFGIGALYIFLLN